MKGTVSAIARSCGLSTATVDRTLNDRPGVTPANRHRVMEAALRLGYLPTVGGMALPSKPAKLEFFIPMGKNAFMCELGRQIENYCGLLPLVASCQIHDLGIMSPSDLRPAVGRLAMDTKGVGIVALNRPSTRDALAEVVQSGIRVVTLLSDVPAALRSAYVGLDNIVAGRTAALLMGRLLDRGSGRGTIAILTGSRSYRGHEEREIGFRFVLSEGFPNLVVADAVEINDESEGGYLAARNLLRGEADLVGIYCVGGGKSGVVRALKEVRRARKPIFICHDLTTETRGFLVDDYVDVVIDQNVRLIAEQTVTQLLGSIVSTPPHPTIKHIEPRLIFRENMPAQ